VFELMWAKLTHFGVMPADPNEISFDTRLLWQGPFQTSSFSDYRVWLGVGLFVIPLAVGAAGLGWWGVRGETRGHVLLPSLMVMAILSWLIKFTDEYVRTVGIVVLVIALVIGFTVRGWWLAREEPRVLVVLAFLVVSAIVAWLVRRTVVLPAMIVPVATAACLVSPARRRLAVATAAVVLGMQCINFGAWHSLFRIQWLEPAERNRQLAEVIDWVDANVPDDEAIASDYLTSTALLANTGHPEVQQPKYETTRSRRRIEELMTTFIRGTPEQLRELLTRWKCRYLVVHRGFWLGHPYTVGISRNSGGVPRTAAVFALCHNNPLALSSAPQFELLYPSRDRFASNQYRVFRLR